jgi:hypothetical protein
VIVISDANVIVYFWKASLLGKLHLSVQIIIPEKIFEEITQGRIQRQYPPLAALINQHRYNPNISNPIIVEQIEHEVDESLEMHEHIQGESGLDDGEIDGIMLSVMKGHPFVTNDSEAIEFFNDVLDHNSIGSAQSFEDFLNDLKRKGHIDAAELRLLLDEKLK